MISETFDQRFKRLTSDMLMLDICRTLGIEIRELMKIRSGIRVELSMERLRRLCQEQGLDFASFTRDYSAPWTSELKPTTPTVTVETEAPAKRRPVETAKPAAAGRPGQETLRGLGATIIEPPDGHQPTHVQTMSGAEGPSPAPASMVGRIKAAVASAAALLAPELPEPGDELIVHDRQQIENYTYSEPAKYLSGALGKDDQAALQTILSEVSSLRREVGTLTARIDELIGR